MLFKNANRWKENSKAVTTTNVRRMGISGGKGGLWSRRGKSRGFWGVGGVLFYDWVMATWRDMCLICICVCVYACMYTHIFMYVLYFTIKCLQDYLLMVNFKTQNSSKVIQKLKLSVLFSEANFSVSWMFCQWCFCAKSFVFNNKLSVYKHSVHKGHSLPGSRGSRGSECSSALSLFAAPEPCQAWDTGCSVRPVE